MQPCPGATYTIKSGDTLWKIARDQNISLDALLQANPGIDPERLKVGQVICLPAPSPAPPQCGAGLVSYTIQPGDTLWELARRSGTTVANIMAHNPSLDPNYLRVGQIICIPAFVTPPPPPRRCGAGLFAYAIKPGDTLWELAKNRGTTVETILRHNPGLDPNNLQVGRIICIP